LGGGRWVHGEIVDASFGDRPDTTFAVIRGIDLLEVAPCPVEAVDDPGLPWTVGTFRELDGKSIVSDTCDLRHNLLQLGDGR
jgi:hypothetical protein